MTVKRPNPQSKTRPVQVGTVTIGGGAPIVLQSMCATRTQDIGATLAQIRLLEGSGADLIRIAVDSRRDVEALREIRAETSANLVVDLQENYRLAKDVAPLVQKFRYNPGHLHHHQQNISVLDKVKFLVDTAGSHDCAIRIGVNFGSIDPDKRHAFADHLKAAVSSAREHCAMLESLGFKRYVVSLKSSNPQSVCDINRFFAEAEPEVPLHLGVTEAGLLPEAEIKSRLALEKLLALGIGDTIRVSLTIPDEEKNREIEVARKICEDVLHGRRITVPEGLPALNVISCPSCSRVENRAFVRLAEEVKRVTEKYRSKPLTVAVMGCRVNGPGETDEADIGLWCAAQYVNVKRGPRLVGAYKYEEVLPVLLQEVEAVLAEKGLAEKPSFAEAEQVEPGVPETA